MKLPEDDWKDEYENPCDDCYYKDKPDECILCDKDPSYVYHV